MGGLRVEHRERNVVEERPERAVAEAVVVVLGGRLVEEDGDALEGLLHGEEKGRCQETAKEWHRCGGQNGNGITIRTIRTSGEWAGGGGGEVEWGVNGAFSLVSRLWM